VDDIKASLTWYCDIVGVTVAEKYEHDGEVRFAVLNAGDGQLMIMQDDWG
jgi:hypothetical protein